MVCLLLLTGASVQTMAQLEDVKANPRTANSLFEEANHRDALVQYLKLSLENPENTFYHYRVGMCFYKMDKNKEAIEHFNLSVVDFDSFSSSSPVDAFYYLAKANHLTHQFSAAIKSYKKYRSYVEFDLQFEVESLKKYYTDNGTGEQAQQMKLIYEDRVIKELLEILFLLDDEVNRCNYGKVLVEVPVDVVIENLGPDVNTEYSEYAPVISTDEKKLAFTSRSPTTTGGELSPDGDYYEDIYLMDVQQGRVSETDLYNQKSNIGYYSILKEIKTSKPQNIGLKFNSDKHEGAVQFSADGKKLFIYRDFNLWVSAKSSSGWETPIKLKHFGSVFNNEAFEPSLTLSINEDVMFFSSDRTGGYGGLDLYVTTKKRDGTWHEPKNMGPVVNTRYDEDAPYIDPNGKTLYFSSKGHSSIGGYDVFKTELHKRKWRSPVNIGYPVNSAGDDVFFMMTPKFNRAYYSSNQVGGYGRMDVYRLTFAEERTLFAEIKGLVLSGQDQIPSFARISILDKGTGEELSVHYSDSITGEYLLLLPHGITYDIRVETEGFVAYQEEYRIPTQISYYQFYQEIKHFHITDMRGNVIGQKVVLENAYFDIDEVVNVDSLADGDGNAKSFVDDLKSSFIELAKNSSETQSMDKSQVKFFISEDSLSSIMKEDSSVYNQIKDVIAFSDSLEGISQNRDESYSEFVSSLMHTDNEIEFANKADIKFYISQDSLVTLLREDTTIYAQIKEIMVPAKLLEDGVERPYHKFIVGMIEEDLATMSHIEQLSNKLGVPVDSLVADMQREQMLDGNALSEFGVKFFDQEEVDVAIIKPELFVEPKVLKVKPDTVDLHGALTILIGGKEDKKGDVDIVVAINNSIEGRFDFSRLPKEFADGLTVYLLLENGDTLSYKVVGKDGMFVFHKLENDLKYALVIEASTIEPNINAVAVKSAATTQTGVKLAKSNDLAKRVNSTLIEAKQIEEDIGNLIKNKRDEGEIIVNLPSLAHKEKKKLDESHIATGDVVATFYFGFDHSEMKSINCVYLSEFYRKHKDDDHLKFRIVGHTDSEGSAEYNLNLSEERARWVGRYLHGLGLEWINMDVEWKGETKLAVNDRNSLGKLLITEMHKNRRVEIIAIHK